MSTKATSLLIVALGLFCGLGLVFGLEWASATRRAGPEPGEAWQRVVASEELILELTPQLDRLARALENLELPGAPGEPGPSSFFAERVDVVDLVAPEGVAEGLHPALAVDRRRWRVDPKEATLPRDGLRIWRALLDSVHAFEHAGFGVLRGEFLDAERTHFETDLKVSARARTKAGGLWAVEGAVTVRWRREGEAWLVEGWRTRHLHTVEASRTMMAEVLDEAVPDREARVQARSSIHEQLVSQYLLEPESFTKPHPSFTVSALDRHPGLAVADVDGDGIDDIYAVSRWNRAQLFLGRGDGTFEEAAEAFGLDFVGLASSALFADFDNDGDADLFLGRTLVPSLYLVNEGGRFVDRSADLVDGPLPALVSSISAADVDGDGLLDVHFATYAARMAAQDFLRQGEAAAAVLEEYLPPEDARRLAELLSRGEWHQVSDHFGPPNVLLRNAGSGRFAPLADAVARAFRNTYQGTWSDFDLDGDPDLYLANDFARNNLLRNDGGGRFVDVTGEAGVADIGFGMGASWGDYDNDGRPDLYVSNMFSKAGRRITAALPDLDPRFGAMARGNSLFRGEGEGRSFRRVSGLEPPALTVEAAGWSWGTQFVDLDSDGFLDLYALSGYYSAPREAALAVDL